MIENALTRVCDETRLLWSWYFDEIGWKSMHSIILLQRLSRQLTPGYNWRAFQGASKQPDIAHATLMPCRAKRNLVSILGRGRLALAGLKW